MQHSGDVIVFRQIDPPGLRNNGQCVRQLIQVHIRSREVGFGVVLYRWFADLGCDGDAPATASVCGATDTMQLPAARLNPWENIPAPLTCGSKNVPAAELARWQADSIAIGGMYSYPKTQVQFYDCTNQATAVTAMAQLFHDQITSAKAYHCYTQADGCQGEGLGPTGNSAAMAAMTTGCVPRHQ